MNKYIILIGLIFVVLALTACTTTVCEPDVCNCINNEWHVCSYDTGTYTWDESGVLCNETSPCESPQ